MTLEELGARWRTDKGTVHSYLPVYEEFIGPIRERDITLLEIGVHSGSSLGMWLEWMPNAKIIGVDKQLITHPEFGHERLTLLEFDQSDERALHRCRELRLDVVIDDGSHKPADQLMTCHGLWRCLKPGGLYFIEDVPAVELLHYWEMMPGYRSWVLQKDGRVDDILVLLRKPE